MEKIFSSRLDPMSISIRAVRLGIICNEFRLRLMKYLCLIFVDQQRYDALPQSEQNAYVKEHFALDDALREQGHLIVTEALQPAKSAATIKVRNGKLSITDGPFAETKEQLGGFYLIEARDLNDAIRIAAKIPSARIGTVEVRPILELE